MIRNTIAEFGERDVFPEQSHGFHYFSAVTADALQMAARSLSHEA